MSRGEDRSWPAQCRNCGADLHGPYCSACGQSHVHGRLELRELAEDALDGLVNLDTRALRTIGDLTIAPAKVCLDYIDGRRVRYINPFKYVLATFTFAVLVAELLLYLHGSPVDAVDANMVAFRMRWGMLIYFLAMPLVAVCLWPLFAKAPRQLRWVEHFVVVMFTFGHATLLQGLLDPMLKSFESTRALVFAALPVALLCWVAVGVYGTRWWTTIPRVLLAVASMQLVAVGILRLLVPDLAAAD